MDTGTAPFLPHSAIGNYRRAYGTAIKSPNARNTDIAAQQRTAIRSRDDQLAYLLHAEHMAAERVHDDIEDAWNTLDERLAELVAARAATLAHLTECYSAPR